MLYLDAKSQQIAGRASRMAEIATLPDTSPPAAQPPAIIFYTFASIPYQTPVFYTDFVIDTNGWPPVERPLYIRSTIDPLYALIIKNTVYFIGIVYNDVWVSDAFVSICRQRQKMRSMVWPMNNLWSNVQYAAQYLHRTSPQLIAQLIRYMTRLRIATTASPAWPFYIFHRRSDCPVPSSVCLYCIRTDWVSTLALYAIQN